MKPSRRNTKKTTVRHIIKLMETNYKEKIFKAARKKKNNRQIMYRRTKIRYRFLLGNDADEKTEQHM